MQVGNAHIVDGYHRLGADGGPPHLLVWYGQRDDALREGAMFKVSGVGRSRPDRLGVPAICPDRVGARGALGAARPQSPEARPDCFSGRGDRVS